MPAATPRFYFQPLCQHEVLRVISTHYITHYITHGHKIVEILHF